MTAAVVAHEVRLLEGPNLYFTKPAVKVSLSLPGFLAAPSDDLRALNRSIGLKSRVGAADSIQRQAYLQRLTQRVARLVVQSSGGSRVGIRVRQGASPGDIVVAAVWRRRGRAETFGEGLAPLLSLIAEGADPSPSIADLARRMKAAPDGRPPEVLTPRVPVASITGTNGKTTTTRLLAHIAMTAGKKTAWSSTDGIVVQGEVVEPGDYSGPAGARGVLAAPGLEVAVLETARGGLLLKGMGVSTNDVSVVTNVSADHLGMQGIDTLDQLAEVKAIVTTVTKPSGYAVLNAEDPRVWAMHNGTKARPWAFSLDPAAPALREAIGLGGRAITVLDDVVTVLQPAGAIERLLPLLEIPATLAGLSHHNTANVLAGAAAALALGLPREAVIEGLRTFNPDDRLNPGRMNIYSVPVDGGSVSVIVDLAHNEAGLQALLDVARGLRQPGARVLLALGTAGDRTDEILEALGEIAGQCADHVVIGHKEHYLRGRTTADFERHFGAGLARAGLGDVASYRGEEEAASALAEMATDGDVIAVMTHERRGELVQWLTARGGRPDDADDIARKVAAAQGRHDLDEEFAAMHDLEPVERVTRAEQLRDRAPADARVAFECAAALDAAGRDVDAVAGYERALGLGLREPTRHRAQLQLATALRIAGRYEEAAALLDQLAHDRPESAAVTAYRALTAHAMGRTDDAIAELVEALLIRATDDDSRLYRGPLLEQVAAFRA